MLKKTRKPSEKGNSEVMKKKSVKEQILEEAEGIIVQNVNEEEEFLCKACKYAKSAYHSGKWHNCKTHLSRSSHVEAVIKYNERNEDTLINEAEKLSEDREIINQEQKLTPTLKAELDLTYSQFILQKRLPFSLAASIHQLTKQIVSKYSGNVLEEYNINRNTISASAQVISETLKIDLYQKLSSSPFSLSFDASSDLNGHTFLAICARQIESESYDRPTTKLVSVLPITTSSTGETLHDLILKNVLINEDIKGNFLGIATDDGKNMTGKDLGASTRLKVTCPHISTFKDLSHIFDNALKKGLLALPSECKDLIREIISHFSYSTQKSSLLRNIFEEMGIKPLEILKLSKTRWLSWRNSTERIIELWPGLKKYFEEHGNKTQKEFFTEKNELSVRILLLLTHSHRRAYIYAFL